MSVADGLSAGRGRAPRRTIAVQVPLAGLVTTIGGGIALVLVLSAFVGTGGLRLEPTTRVLIGLMLAGGALCAAAALRAPRTAEEPLYGSTTLLAFAALAAFTGASVIWSLTPGDSWVETNRTVAYLATFAGSIALARLYPRAWRGVLAGLAAGSFAICAWALLTKIFPDAFSADETFARLRAPFDYWNAVGLTAAFGILPLLWMGTRRQGNPLVSALAAPAIALMLVCLLLSYSRGSLIALAAGLAFWFAAVPLRIAGVSVLGLASVGAAPVIWWAFLQDGLTTDNAPMAARADAGHELGSLLLLVVVVLTLAGIAAQFIRSAHSPSPRFRRNVVRALAGLGTVALIGSIAIASASPGGLGGQVSEGWRKLVDPHAPLPANTPDRLKETSSVRARYYDEALKVHGLSPWVGVGAGGYAVARTRFRQNAVQVRQAHGYVPQTLADLGWIGFALSLAALIAWLVTAARTTGLQRRDRGLPYDPERIGALTLFAAVIAFGVHSGIDWTWFVPANMVAGLVAAGWLAGRPPLRRRLLAADEAPPAPAEREGRFAFVRGRPFAAAAAALLLVTALAASWTAYQPVRSAHAGDAAFERLSTGAYNQAAAIAQTAIDRDPLSVDARFDLATVEQARGQLPAAEEALHKAIELEPGNAETWRRLGRFQLYDLQKPEDAVKTLRVALVLDPVSMTSRSDLLLAARQAQGR
jgi:tetratricopeptide (TPR) repeat protein